MEREIEFIPSVIRKSSIAAVVNGLVLLTTPCLKQRTDSATRKKRLARVLRRAYTLCLNLRFPEGLILPPIPSVGGHPDFPGSIVAFFYPEVVAFRSGRPGTVLATILGCSTTIIQCICSGHFSGSRSVRLSGKPSALALFG